MHGSHIDGQLPALITVALTVFESNFVNYFFSCTAGPSDWSERVRRGDRGGKAFWRGKRAWQALTAGPSGSSGADIQYGIDQRAMPCCT